MDWKDTMKDIGLAVGQQMLEGFDQASKKLTRERDGYEYCPAGKNLSEMIDEYRKKIERRDGYEKK